MDILKPKGVLDCVYYYSLVAKKCRNFLKDRELVGKVFLPGGITLIRRASKLKPLYADELIKAVDDKFLELRVKNHLKDVKNKLTKEQINVWEHFFPRKLCEFHYAVNHEGKNKDIDRIYFDIDRKNNSVDEALKVSKELIKIIKRDFSKKTLLIWTGHSFHVYTFFNKKPHSFYITNFSGKNNLVIKWAKEISEKTKIKTCATHEKKRNMIIIDPSQSTSGKIGRVPYSLHVSNGKINGVGYVVNNETVKFLESLTAEKIVRNDLMKKI